MKLLLTGEPRSGKSTLINGFVAGVPNKLGFSENEIRVGGERIGFETVSSLGNTSTIASIHSDSDVRVSRYGVDVAGFSRFLDELPEPEDGQLLYIDEIGQMELQVDGFTSLAERWLSRTNPFIGTITKVYSDDFTERVKAREDVGIIEVTHENRDELAVVFGALARDFPLLSEDGSSQPSILDRFIQ